MRMHGVMIAITSWYMYLALLNACGQAYLFAH